MQIELVKVGEVTNDGKYARMRVDYIRDGKSANRNLVAIGKTKDVMQSLSQFTSGDLVEVTIEKSSDGEFWNWIGVDKVEAQKVAEEAKTSYKTKSTYETPEERAKRQVLIVRQSSLSNAIEFLGPKSSKIGENEVLNLAELFTAFVFQTYTPEQGVAKAAKLAAKGAKEASDDFQDDIPF